jgi:hypothetical protein
MKKYFTFGNKIYRCFRCDTRISFVNVSKGYFGYCSTHDEDVYSIEVYLDA